MCARVRALARACVLCVCTCLLFCDKKYINHFYMCVSVNYSEEENTNFFTNGGLGESTVYSVTV